MHFPTWLVGPFMRAGQFANDRLSDQFGVRIEARLGFTQQRNQVRDYVLVTVYNRTDKPEKVENVYLRFSHRAGALLIPNPVGPFKAPPQIVTRTENYVFGFPLDEVRRVLTEKRAELNPGPDRSRGSRSHNPRSAVRPNRKAAFRPAARSLGSQLDNQYMLSMLIDYA